MIRINDIIDKISDYYPDADLDLIDRAYIYSARVHDGQVRLSGEPYLSHPLEVSGILADMRLDVVSVAAGLLHDVVEDTHASEEEIKDIFGPEVAHIVSGVTKLSKLTFDSLQARQAESIRKMILAMADDIRVILIKLADRLHNMRTLTFQKPKRKIAIAQETIDIYSPIASRLGIFWIKKELEDIAFRFMQPDVYDKIIEMVDHDKLEHENYIEMVKDRIQQAMDENNIRCEVQGRYKNAYSIHNKMVKQSLAFEDVYDIIAFRIVLGNSIPQCYEALGIIHSMWKPIGGKIKDYIAVPKPNMYQSLHTTVIGPSGERIEVQIRTQDMDKIAKSGIAAHWSYKEGKQTDEKANRAFAWIQNLVDNQESFSDPKEFIENVRIDLFPDEVYVFTPNGEIKTVPKGATPVDFAYLIHTEVGNQCTGAKVNGRMVPLQYQLKVGDSIEIITTKGHTPSKDWLNFVKTVKARSRIRQWIKSQEKERSLTLGREMCEKAFRKHKLNFTTLSKTEKMNEVTTHFGFKTFDDLIANVGYGKITPLQIVRKFEPKEEEAESQDSFIDKIIGRVKKKHINKSGVTVKGIDDVLVRFGKCCQPVPGDTISGYITRGYGVTIHRSNCVNLLKITPDRQIEVEWDGYSTDTYPVKVLIKSHDRRGLLADIAAAISKLDSNIIDLNTKTRESMVVESYFTLAVKNTEHLSDVLNALNKIKSVHEVKRLDVKMP